MRACDLKDCVLSNEKYLRFKDVLGRFTDSFRATTEQLGKDLLAIRECRALLNPPLGVMTEGEQENYWKWLLEVCRLHGFAPAD
jgi:hypothetical protein